jgi:hypothetical protein
MLNKEDILESLGYHKSSLGYQMAETFLNSQYVQVIEQDMLKAIEYEKLRLLEEKAALHSASRDLAASNAKVKISEQKQDLINMKIIGLVTLELGIKREIKLNLKSALRATFADPNNLLNAHVQLDQPHLKKLIENFHGHKLDSSNVRGFAKNVSILIDAQKPILGVERRGILGVLKHILGGLLAGLGLGMPLL